MPKRRANGEGSICKRNDGRWQVTFPTGIYNSNGRAEVICLFRKTKQEAVEVLRMLKAELNKEVG
jgi:integrase